MGALLYYISIPFIYLLSLLPFPLLYAFSDFMYVLLFRIIGYRKKIVLNNLRNSFSEKSEQEIQAICKRFYHYLCDLFIETFKTLTISRKEMLKHCHLTADAQQLFDRLADEKKNLILVMGHYGNWEWGGNAFSMQCRQQLYVIYHPIANKYFDGLMSGMRTRFGAKLMPMKTAFKDMLRVRDTLNATAFIADQTPSSQNAYWTTFLNQETPVFWGTEVIAKKLNTTVVYIHIELVKRGYYELHAEILKESPSGTAEGEISELHTKRLEQDIIARPETWLWSHRRWKHKREAHGKEIKG